MYIMSSQIPESRGPSGPQLRTPRGARDLAQSLRLSFISSTRMFQNSTSIPIVIS
jgi:hypothetical protein